MRRRKPSLLRTLIIIGLIVAIIIFYPLIILIKNRGE